MYYSGSLAGDIRARVVGSYNKGIQMIAVPNYDITRTIGSGAFGFVFEAVDRRTGRRVALKRVERVGKGLSRENEILMMLRGCPNVIQIEDLFYSSTEKGKLVQNIIFQYLEDNLENLIQNHAKRGTAIPQPLLKRYIYQILNGVGQVHAKQVAHRDLKPENILIDGDGHVKICDFGCSKVIDPKGKNTPYVVSQYYRAPELIMGITQYSTAVDMWSVGCIMAELVLLEPLFVGANEGDQLFAILKVLGSMGVEEEREYRKRVPFEPGMMASFRGFNRSDLKCRFQGVEEQDLFADLMMSMLEYLPERRITAASALNHAYFKDILEDIMVYQNR